MPIFVQETSMSVKRYPLWIRIVTATAILGTVTYIYLDAFRRLSTSEFVRIGIVGIFVALMLAAAEKLLYAAGTPRRLRLIVDLVLAAAGLACAGYLIHTF